MGRQYGKAAHTRGPGQSNHHYIIGGELRSGSAKPGRLPPGRYADAAANLRVKEVRIAEHERFVICHNPEGAEPDAAIQARMLAQLSELINDTDTLTATKRAELRSVISTKPGLNRYLRVTPSGLLRTDAKAIKAEANLDGKYLLRTSDPSSPPRTSPWDTSSSWSRTRLPPREENGSAPSSFTKDNLERLQAGAHSTGQPIAGRAIFQQTLVAYGQLPRVRLLRLVLSRLAAGQRRANLIGESDGDEPLLKAGTRIRGRGHQEPPLEQAAGLDEQLGIGTVRQVLELETPGPASAVTRPSRCSRAGLPIPAMPY